MSRSSRATLSPGRPTYHSPRYSDSSLPKLAPEDDDSDDAPYASPHAAASPNELRSKALQPISPSVSPAPSNPQSPDDSPAEPSSPLSPSSPNPNRKTSSISAMSPFSTGRTSVVSPPPSIRLSIADEKQRPDKCLKEGFLTKIGEKRKNWKTRYFKLYFDRLQYYKDGEGGARLLGSILLPGATLSVFQTGMYPGHSYCFGIQPSDSQRQYIIEADNPKHRTEWLEMLKTLTKQSIQSVGESVKEGFLNKRGDIVHNWKRRYFILTAKSLRYYSKLPIAESDANKPIKEVDLSVDFQLGRMEEIDGHKFIFFVKPEKSTRIWYFECINEVERMEWMSSFRGLGVLEIDGDEAEKLALSDSHEDGAKGSDARESMSTSHVPSPGRVSSSSTTLTNMSMTTAAPKERKSNSKTISLFNEFGDTIQIEAAFAEEFDDDFD